MIAEQIEQLEARVEGLMRVLETLREKNNELAEENARLQQELGKAGETQSINEQLQNQVRQLEEEVEGRAARETQIRERLQGILGKIDMIVEQEGSGAQRVTPADHSA